MIRFSLLGLALLAACSGSPKEANKAIDAKLLDASIRPQDDYWGYTNKKWLAKNPIPADKTSSGSFTVLADASTEVVKGIVADCQSGKLQSFEAGLIRDLYASGMDEVAIEAAGLEPLRPLLAKIDALTDAKDLPKLWAELSVVGGPMPFSAGIGPDNTEVDKYTVWFGQGGLGMGSRDYYLDASGEAKRTAYKEYLTKLCSFAGQDVALAEQIFALELALATASMPAEDARITEKIYNKKTLAELEAVFEGLNWSAYMQGTGYDKAPFVIVMMPDFFAQLAKLAKTTPLDTWKAYLRAHTINGFTAFLPKAILDAGFAFKGQVMSGQKQLQPRETRVAKIVSSQLDQAIGKEYVKRAFSEKAKTRCLELVENIRKAYAARIDKLSWMSPETKKRAQDKLASMGVKIGYPDKARSYEGCGISKQPYASNMMELARFNKAYSVAKLGKPMDKSEWGMSPQTVNAYYSADWNEIVFPAAILQPPFYSEEADDAVNYGGIGAVIGHEFTHGFDDEGRKTNKDGKIEDWWTQEDAKEFTTRAQAFVNLFNTFSPYPGELVNGQLTLGENIADLGGLLIAYDAMKLAQNGKEPEKISGLTADERFFIGYSQTWRYQCTRGRGIDRLKSDPHSPEKFRVLGPLMSHPEFLTLYNVTESDGMYLDPEKRCNLW